MKIPIAILVVLAGSAHADDRKTVSIRVTATATSAMPKHPAWRAIGQVAGDRYGWCLDNAAVGESITFAFDAALPINELDITAGYGPEWQAKDRDAEYGMPDRLEIKTDKQTLAVGLKRAEPDKIALSGDPVRSITLKIASVKKGKVAPVCINRVDFVGPKIQYRNVYGMDVTAFQKLPSFATTLDAGFKTCDVNVFQSSIRFPVERRHSFETLGMDEGLPPITTVYKTARELEKDCDREGSVLQLGLAGEPWHRDDAAAEIAQPFSETNGEVHIGDWQRNAWWLAATADGWKLTRFLTSEDRTVDTRGTIAAMAADQAASFAPDGTLVLVERTTAVAKPSEALERLVTGAHKESDVAVTFARDRRSAVLSFVETVKDHTYRVSELVVLDHDDWKIVAGMWSEPKPNDAVNKAASAGAITFTRVAAPGAGMNDPLADGFYAMQKGTFEATRNDVIVFGSGPKERTVGGPKFVKAWNAAWANHIPMDASGILSKLAPTNTTGWLVTDVMLEKHAGDKLYLIPFRLFLVFDKVEGRWNLLHAHIATVAP